MPVTVDPVEGVSVQDAGNPVNGILAVDTTQVGCVIVPIDGAAVVFTVIVTVFDVAGELVKQGLAFDVI